jgi:putative transposase
VSALAIDACSGCCGGKAGKSANTVYRLYTAEGLALRRKRPWRHASAVHREQRRPATYRNDIWSMDCVADQLADGRRFRALTVLDLFTRECLAIDVGQGLSGRDVVATLERLSFERGLPQRIDCDNGTEFVSAAMDLWEYSNTVILDFSRRGKPTDNAAIESFNGGCARRMPQRALVCVTRRRAAENRYLPVGLQ